MLLGRGQRGDEAKGEGLKLVPDRIGWPGPGEPISDHIASIALDRGKLDIVARYIREVVVPLIRNRDRGVIHTTDALYKLADMLEPRPGLDRYFKLCRTSRGAPSNRASTLLQKLEIGSHVHRLIEGGVPLKAAMNDVRKARGGLEKTKVYQAYKDYQKYRECDDRGAPMPIPDRPTRRRRSPHKQSK